MSFLRKRTPRAYFVYVLIVLLLLSVGVIDSIVEYLNGQTTLVSRPYKLLIPIIVLFLSLFCNRVFVISDTFKTATLWPGYMFALLLLSVSNQTTAFQALAHGTIGILILYDLLKIQFNSNASKNCYNIGLYVGIAFIVDSEMLWVAPFVLYAITSLKPLVFKEYLLYILGLLTPLYFLLAFCFLTSDYTAWNNILPYQDWFQFNHLLSFWNWIQWALVMVLMLMLLFLTFMQYNSLPVYIRRLSSAMLYIIGSLMIVAMVSGFGGFLIFYLAPAFAFFATMLMLKYSNNPRQEVIHLIFVVLIVGVHLISNFL